MLKRNQSNIEITHEMRKKEEEEEEEEKKERT
jgi:hypothetical protein